MICGRVGDIDRGVVVVVVVYIFIDINWILLTIHTVWLLFAEHWQYALVDWLSIDWATSSIYLAIAVVLWLFLWFLLLLLLLIMLLLLWVTVGQSKSMYKSVQDGFCLSVFYVLVMSHVSSSFFIHSICCLYKNLFNKRNPLHQWFNVFFLHIACSSWRTLHIFFWSWLLKIMVVFVGNDLYTFRKTVFTLVVFVSSCIVLLWFWTALWECIYACMCNHFLAIHLINTIALRHTHKYTQD